MKIDKYEIQGGPNWQFYAVTFVFVACSYDAGTVWPIMAWLGFCACIVPACIWMAAWTERENEQMLKDFPDDPYIQKKYSPKKIVD